MASCLFCDMVSGKAEASKLHDDNLVFSIRDIHPRAPVHLMVIPKEHISGPPEIGEGHGPLLAHMFMVANKLAQKEGLTNRGYRLAVNCGGDAGQTIYHIHLHVLGGQRLGAEG